MDSGVKNPFIYIRAFHVAPLEDGKPIISYLLPLEADPAFKQLFTFGYPEEVEESFWNMKVYFSLCDNDRMVVCCSSQGNNCITSFVFVMDIWNGNVLWYHKKNVSHRLPMLSTSLTLTLQDIQQGWFASPPCVLGKSFFVGVGDLPGSFIEVTWDEKSDSYSCTTLTSFCCRADDDNENRCGALNITKDGKYLFAALTLVENPGLNIRCIDLQAKKELWSAEFKGLVSSFSIR